MKIAVIQFPGSNCERETMLAIQRAGMQAVEYMWNQPLADLKHFAGYVIVGGFSYEDRSRAGVIAALDPVMQALKKESEQGKPILGICNGAQILVESGLVPGLENYKVGIALAENKRMIGQKVLGTGYYNAWVHLRLSENYQRNAFTRHLNLADVLHVPVAHAEGRFILSPALLQEVQIQGLDVFQYCDAKGVVQAEFPINPNGSVANIAAISNKYGNVLAIMPHPERTINGDALFTSMREYISEGQLSSHIPLYYYPRKTKLVAYDKPPQTYECIVESIITDNHARTVQSTLNKLGLSTKVNRYTHWEISCEEKALAKLLNSDLLYNPRKERVIKVLAKGETFLVQAKEDWLGMQKYQALTRQEAIPGLKSLKYGLLWNFQSENAKIANQILSTNIISNPYAHDCFSYIS